MSLPTRDTAATAQAPGRAAGASAVVVLPTELRVHGATVLGWWHEPGRVVGPPVLLCGPWGDEAIGAYRGQYDLAQDLAAAGWPVLRLDWPGDGDSADLPDPAELAPAWIQAVQVGVAAARRQHLSDAVWLLGVHWGGLVAAQALQQGLVVAGVVLLAPPASGRSWLREARLLASPGAPGLGPAGAVRVGGLELPAPAAEAVAAWTWDGLAQAPAVLACTRTDRPWSAPLAAQRVQVRPRGDLGELVSTAHAARWPAGLGQALLAWMGAHTTWPLRPLPSPSPARPPEPPPLAADTAGWRECAIDYGGGRWGVLTEPRTPRSGGQTVLLLASGAERRIGPHRLWVPWARHRAAHGDRVLRIDLQGFGDSAAAAATATSPAAATDPAADPGMADRIYAPQRRQDLGAAVAWLREQAGAGRLTVLGLCSGAHHAWRAAVEGLAVDAVVPINPLVFHWQPGTPLDPARMAFGQISVADGAVRSLRDPARWGKLLRGQVRLGVILPAVLARARLALRARGRNLARRLQWPLAADVGTELRQLARRGVTVHFVFAQGDPGQTLLQQEAGSVLPGLIRHGHVQLTTVAPGDHTFSWPAAREALYKRLDAVLANGAGTDAVQGTQGAQPSSRAGPSSPEQ